MYTDRFANAHYMASPATGTTEANIRPLQEVMDWAITANTADVRVRFDKPVEVSAAPVAYKYTAATATWAALTLPWALSGMTSSDRLFVGVQGEPLSALEITVGSVNGNAAVLTAYMASKAGELTKLLTADWTAVTTTDGTASGGKTLAQNGRVVIAPPVEYFLTSYGTYGLYWTEFRVNATLTSPTTITACKALGLHFTIATGATQSGKNRWSRVYYRTDSGSGTLTIHGATSA